MFIRKAGHISHGVCEKCAQHAELYHATLALGKHYGERWSGVVNGEHRWYDVSRAKNVLESHNITRDRCQRFSVSALWETQIRDSYIVEGHLYHTDPTAPVILVTTHVDPDRGDCLTLVDGIHRVARAHRECVSYIDGIKLSLAFSDSLLVEPREAILDELIAEAASTGGKLVVRDGVAEIVGGTVRDAKPTDHPLRASMIEAFRRGPVLVNLRV